MPDDLPHHRDRYATTGNVAAEYVDAERTVLANKKGITDQATLMAQELEYLAKAYGRMMNEVRRDSKVDRDLLKQAHSYIFGDLYEWAGRWRTVWISKPGVTWPAPDFLERNMQEFEEQVLRKYPVATLVHRDAFCQAVAEIQGEFLVIHPFREGNARTIKLITDVMAVQIGRSPLVYETSDPARQQYTDASRAAFRRDYRPMTAVIRLATDHWKA